MFGIVYEAVESITNESVAIKVVNKMALKQQNPKAYQLFEQEVQILSIINNENVINYIDYFEDSITSYLVLEYCNEGDMEHYLVSKQTISEQEAIEYFRQIMNGMTALHSVNVVHRE